MNSSELQIWNNAAFDTGEFENTRKTSFFLDQSDFPDSSSIKENRNPISVKTPAKGNPLQQPIGNSFLIPNPQFQNPEEIRDEKKIDSEMEEIKKEITRLTSRLEALRLEKAELRIKALDKLGRMVPAKFKEQKQTVNVRPTRGFSLGPSEIGGGFRRGVSMGPAEIYSASKSKQLGKQETVFTPVHRRKSCFLKLDDVDEDRAMIGLSFTVDSKPPRRTITKTPTQRQAATTVGLKKEASRTVGMSSSSIQPKKLFSKEVDKSQPINKIMPGRIVASRYNQSSSVSKSAIRKRSFPENDEETMMKKTGNSGKKKWEIPSEIMIQGNNVYDGISPRGILMPNRIRTVRRIESETPRDSGPAKRVVDLVGRRSFFYDGVEDDDGDESVSKMLNFAEEEEDDQK
ncbi:uncharacterized protein LOC124910412 [Impatiens glandulifera]|uniref:uncharacterized protein LOC124910412 n=1 Tax=Impatiens glandulifera TaxID=253017 RepID=UPI001FB13639|nr:uncharacterized protein LOC124910412 [Impatiens glandulifera]